MNNQQEKLCLRPASKEEVDKIFTYIMLLASYEKLEDTVRATPASIAQSIFEERAADAYFIELAGDAVGMVITTTTFSTFEGRPTLYIEDIIIEEAYRGRGFGTTIFELLAAIALEKDYRRMDWTCLDWNAPSIAFYEKRGAEPLSDWTTFRLDAAGIKALAND